MINTAQNIYPAKPAGFFDSCSEEKIHSRGFRIGKVARVAAHILLALSFVTTAASIAAACILTTSLTLTAAAVSAAVSGILLMSKITLLIKRHLPPKLQGAVNAIRSFIVEFFAKIALFSLCPLKQTWFDPKKSRVDMDQTPTLLVHGYIQNSSNWTYFRYRLKQAGLKNVFTIDLGNPFLSIEAYAEKVQKKAQEIQKLTGRSDLKLIGHSMGGVVSSYYAIHCASGKTVKSVITLGAPLNGTKLGIIGIGKCAKQMLYKSAFIRNLRQEIKESSLPFYHIGSKTDFIIRPSTSTIIKKHKFTRFDNIGHGSYLFSDRVIRHCVEELNRNGVVA